MGQQSRSAVYDIVRTRIMAGHYPPGAHLTEAELCTELGASRTPVRAALRQLSDEGLVQTEPHRGAFVAEMTRADIDEVFELRAVLEARGAHLAALRRSEDDCLELRRSVRRMEALAKGKKQTRKDELHHNNRDFHLLVHSSARSPRLLGFIKQLTNTSVTSGTFFYYNDEDIARSVHFHRDIADAIIERRPELAAALMSAHLGQGHVSFMSERFDDASEDASHRDVGA